MFSCSAAHLKKAAESVKKGGIVVYPTDTVYGIGCDPYNKKAILKIFEIKKRERKPLPVLCSSLDRAQKLVEFCQKGLELARRFWPGPLTIVGRVIDDRLPNILSLGSGKLGVRIPNHNCALMLIKLSGGTLVGTSANISGLKSPTSPKDVMEVLQAEYDILLDGGETPLKTESTVIEIRDRQIVLLRERAVSKMALGL